MSTPSAQRYATVAIVLHWLIAAAIVLQLVLATRMGGRTPQGFAITQLHKSVGLTILLASLLRIAWRLTHRPPPEPPGLARWERRLAGITHAAFYVVMIAMPLTGWLMVSASRTGIPTLFWGVVPWPNLPGVAQLAPAAKLAWHDLAEASHNTMATGIYGLLALHVAGALKHQLFSRDEPVLGRMAPGAVPGRWVEPRLAAIALAAAGVVAFGLLVQPRLPAMAPPPPAPVQAAPVQAAPVQAAPQPASVAPAAPVQSGPARWTVQPGSSLTFATAWSGAPIQGRFDRWTAEIRFDPDALETSKVSVAVDMGSARTGDPQRDAALPSADWFDSAAHPKANFTATRFTKTGADRYVAHGTLSLRGVARPLDLPFRLTIAGDTAQATGAATLDRTAFGVGQGEFAATDAVPAKVTVRVQITARREAPRP